jgi:hypothetical protein
MTASTQTVIEAAVKATCARVAEEGCTCPSVDVKLYRQSKPDRRTVLATAEGIWRLVVEHDDDCPLLKGRTS